MSSPILCNVNSLTTIWQCASARFAEMQNRGGTCVCRVTHPIPQHVVVQGLSCLQPNAFLWVFIGQKQPVVIGCRSKHRVSHWMCVFLAHSPPAPSEQLPQPLSFEVLVHDITFNKRERASLSMLMDSGRVSTHTSAPNISGHTVQIWKYQKN